MAAVSRERLFETFMELLDPLGFTVDVVLETSHNRHNKGHTDLYREHIDLPVLKSVFWEYEDLLLNDGCTGLAVLNPDIPQEIQFDEHKLLIVYGEQLQEYENACRERGDRLQRADPLRHRGRTRPFLQRRLRPPVRRATNPAGHGLRLWDGGAGRGLWTRIAAASPHPAFAAGLPPSATWRFGAISSMLWDMVAHPASPTPGSSPLP